MTMELHGRVVIVNPTLDGYSPTFERQPSAVLCLLVAIEELREKRNGGSPLQIYFTEYSEVADIQNGIRSQILGCKP